MFNALKDQPGRKVILIYVAGGGDPLGKIKAMQPERFDIEISTGGHILPVLPTYKQVPGMEGAIYYYYESPDNAVNDWLVATHQERFDSPPDFFTAGGMAAALAVVQGAGNGRGARDRSADRGDGRHELGNTQGHDDLPPGGSPGAAVDVSLQDPRR